MKTGNDNRGTVKENYKIFNFRRFRWNVADLS
jgi:hypothetical protein